MRKLNLVITAYSMFCYTQVIGQDIQSKDVFSFGYKSEIEFSTHFSKDEYVISSFLVSSSKEILIDSIRIITRGLGDSGFSLNGNNYSNEIFLRPKKRVTKVLMKIPKEQAKGEVVLLFGSKPIDQFSINVKTAKVSTFVTSINWFFSILIPAVLTILLGYVSVSHTNKIQRRQREKEDFENYRRKHIYQLNNFFNHIYPHWINYDDLKFSETLQKQLDDKNFLDLVPFNQWSKLGEAFNKADKNLIKQVLREIFPECADSILNPKKIKINE